MEDMHSLSLPLALVYFDVASADGTPHDVQLFFEATAQLIVDDDASPVVWARDEWAAQSGAGGPSKPTFPRPMHPRYPVLAQARFWCLGARMWLLTSREA